MTSKRTKCRERLSGAGYKRQRLERDEQNMMGAAALQHFLVPVQIPPQNSGQEHAIPGRVGAPGSRAGYDAYEYISMVS